MGVNGYKKCIMATTKTNPEEQSIKNNASSGRTQKVLEATYKGVFQEIRGGRFLDMTKDTQYNDAWLVLCFIVLMGGVFWGNSFLTTAALILFVIAAVSKTWNQLSLFGLYYKRHLSETRAFVGETITLTLEVCNRKFLPLTWLQISDVFPADLPIKDREVFVNNSTNLGEFRSFWMLGAFQSIQRDFEVECTKRGYHNYGPATISTGDGFGLFDRKVTLPTKNRLIIYPQLYSAEELKLPAKNPFGESPSHHRLFEDPLRTIGIREWQPSDSLRRVHWKATARYQSLLSRLYEPSEEAQMVIFLNVATMRRHWQGYMPELHERAISVAGSLSAVCIEKRLSTGLIANAGFPGTDKGLHILPSRNPDQLTQILELLAAVTPFATSNIEDMILHESPRLSWGATFMIVTAIAHDDLLIAMLELARAGRKIILFTLAEKPPTLIDETSGIKVYHLPHLVEDLIAPEEIFVHQDLKGLMEEVVP